ncbi:Peptidase S8, subtilisin-related protein [Ophiocordyceps sinensis CO18]|uniref:Peptidase S8, subtilisin-related protein n=1 Tax=Ophiocordyceps sinensis (strain Co18 / CGMCC 3.14243) TaxID=911162 RepID=T5AKZ4_OPHSC|nr:Peptidase S8, subtilisin-related protein [Ophiocordyceps sinensis CO18]
MKSCPALVGLLLSTCLAAGLATRAPASSGNDTVVIRNQNTDKTVPNRYLVAFKSGLSDDVVNAKEAELNATISKRNVNKRSLDSRQLSVQSIPFRINDETRGVILDADDATILALARSDEVAFIEADTVGSLDGTVSQPNATTSLVRLSHNKVDGFSSYDYDDTAGQGITVYVLDSGIRLTHNEFEGRATFGANFYVTPGEEDKTGHGSHCAGIIGGATYGVAKKVQLVSVRVEPTPEFMVKAVEFVVEDVKKNKRQGKAIISMSMSVSASEIVDSVFKHAVDSGVVCVVSAGNYGEDAREYSPAREASVITVGAVHPDGDYRWENSNHGPAVDMYGAGVDIESAYHASDSESNVLSGTSQATPQVAGLAAYIMALEGITQPSQVASRLKALAEQSGARVRFNAPNTTHLIASSGMSPPLDPKAPPTKLLPWLKPPVRESNCGNGAFGDEWCGTQIYCNSFYSVPQAKKKGYFKTGQECFDTHEPAPKLPWREASTEVRAESCSPHVINDDCPYVCERRQYTDDLCGTQAYCEAFDDLTLFEYVDGFKDAEACFDRHDPRPNSAKPSQSPTATSTERDEADDGPRRNKTADGPGWNKADDGPGWNKANDGPKPKKADDGPGRNKTDDGPGRNKANDGPKPKKADDGPGPNKEWDG